MLVMCHPTSDRCWASRYPAESDFGSVRHVHLLVPAFAGLAIGSSLEEAFGSAKRQTD